jgi:uncharacterized DUF497 family protein
VKFEWDDAKRLANIAEHDIDFRLATTIFAGDPLILPDRPNAGNCVGLRSVHLAMR